MTQATNIAVTWLFGVALPESAPVAASRHGYLGPYGSSQAPHIGLGCCTSPHERVAPFGANLGILWWASQPVGFILPLIMSLAAKRLDKRLAIPATGPGQRHVALSCL